MQFRTVRCLACHNTDSHYPRLNYNSNEIPYCSSCASTTSLIPDPTYTVSSSDAASKPTNSNIGAPQAGTDFNDLAAMFSKNMMLSQQQLQFQQQYLYHQQQQQLQQQQQQRPGPSTLPTPPLSPTARPTGNFSISQHYHYSSYAPSPPPTAPQQQDDDVDDMMDDDDPVSNQLFGEMESYSQQQQRLREEEMVQQQMQLQQQQAQQEQFQREYAAYLYSSDLSSPSSNDALAIEEAVEQRALANSQALEESCSATAMLQAAARERESKQRQEEEARQEVERKMGGVETSPGVQMSDWYNDYYGGLGSMYESYADADEDAPCCVMGGPGGRRLKPFDY